MVLLTREDEIRMADFLQIEVSVFRQTYCDQQWDGSHILLDRSGTDECIFLQPDNTCRVHTVKPQQCADFPFGWRTQDFFKTCEGWKALEKRSKEVGYDPRRK